MDVLIPVAVGNVLTAENADDVRVDLVVEGVNGPTTSTAGEILETHGILVVPDTLASTGGATISYFERPQDLNHRSWSFERVHDELETEMLRAQTVVRERVEEHDVAWHDAAYMVMLERVSEAHEHHGL